MSLECGKKPPAGGMASSDAGGATGRVGWRGRGVGGRACAWAGSARATLRTQSRISSAVVMMPSSGASSGSTDRFAAPSMPERTTAVLRPDCGGWEGEGGQGG